MSVNISKWFQPPKLISSPRYESYRFSPVEDTVQISFIKITSVRQYIQLNSFAWPSLSLFLSLSGRSLRVYGAEGCSLDDILMVRLFMRLWTPAAGVSCREKSHFTTSTTHKFYTHTRAIHYGLNLSKTQVKNMNNRKRHLVRRFETIIWSLKEGLLSLGTEHGRLKEEEEKLIRCLRSRNVNIKIIISFQQQYQTSMWLSLRIEKPVKEQFPRNHVLKMMHIKKIK